jgi:hypothetical protein
VLSGDLESVCDRASSAGAEVSCGASDVRVGLEITHRVPIEEGIAGWFGGGLGWEWLSLDASLESQGQTETVSFSANGMQVFMAQAGIDFEPVTGLGIGPFVAITMDMYFSTQCEGDCGAVGIGTRTIEDKSWHHWYFLGARVTWQP